MSFSSWLWQTLFAPVWRLRSFVFSTPHHSVFVRERYSSKIQLQHDLCQLFSDCHFQHRNVLCWICALSLSEEAFKSGTDDGSWFVWLRSNAASKVKCLVLSKCSLLSMCIFHFRVMQISFSVTLGKIKEKENLHYHHFLASLATIEVEVISVKGCNWRQRNTAQLFLE